MAYIGFSDESYITDSRFRSIGAISFPESRLSFINEKLQELLTSSGVGEFKWQKLKNAKYRLCAEKLFTFVLDQLHDSDIRVDVLIWDTHDSRHQIQGRDDAANFERMFFHLMNFVMRNRERGASWHLFPDERFGIDWATVEDCLRSVGKRMQLTERPLLRHFLLDEYYQIETFKQANSAKTPCCQLADFFAGIAVFSRTEYDAYEQWLDEETGTMDLFGTPDSDASRGNIERFGIMKGLNDMCKELKLRVSLRERRSFWTPDPQYPVNFWHYTPQHEMDKAPTRARRQ